MALMLDLRGNSSPTTPAQVQSPGNRRTESRTRRRWYAAWLVVIVGFALLHAVHLRADFPNRSPWYMDWAKYTDEGWYGDAAIRAHLLGNWYMPGDFNPAVAVPVWPFLESAVFFFTGVTPQAARVLVVTMFFFNLLLSFMLLRIGSLRWTSLLALTLLVTSPFLYCFGRLAILEPLLTTFLLAALNVAVRLNKMRHPAWGAVGAGLLFALAMLTKTTALFLLPAITWAIAVPLWSARKQAITCLSTAGATFIAGYGLWIALIVRHGLWVDFKYYFFVNNYPRPRQFYWPLISLWWSLHGMLWIDKILVPLAGVLVLAALVFRRQAWARELLQNPVFGSSIFAILGCILFMAYQNHPQPRYFTVAAVFCFFIIALGSEALLLSSPYGVPWRQSWSRISGWGLIGVSVLAAGLAGAQTLNYVIHPQYSFLAAAAQLTRYIDTHPNGKRLLVSISGDQISLFTHLPALCDDFGTTDLPEKLAAYQPGWYAAWNDLDPDTLEDLHTHFSVEQVAQFPAFDDRERDLLVLYKLHPLPAGQARDPQEQDLKSPLPDDSIQAPMQ